ncbi:MAG TPA: alanine--glyoxylate aminotransferase family protein, partial [Candidatus Dormibacteraeota bacterium]|nr:alanine--glyoxylate aminotransferase family protein [Candidatus Dormibacteraeota bacterium]
MAQNQQLRIPGPTPVPARVQRAMDAPMINHRGPEFKALLPELETGLKWAFQTNHDMLIFPASGTGGL